MTNVDTVLFPTPLTGVAVPHGNNVYAPSVDAQGNTLAAYRPGGAHGLNCGPTGGCTVSQVWPVTPEFQALLDSRQLDPDGTGPLPAGAPGSGMNQDWTMSRIAYSVPEPCVVERDDVQRVHRGPRGCGRQHRLDVGGLHISATRLAAPHEELRLDRALREPRTAAELRHGRPYTAQAANSANTQEFTCTSGLPIFEPWILGQLGETIYYNDFQISDDCLTAVTARMSQRNEVEQRVAEANSKARSPT